MTVNNVSVTRRDFLASLTPPLAIAGARGKFSRDAQAALAAAAKDGFVFLDEAAHPENAAWKADKLGKPHAPAPIKAAAPAKKVSLTKATPAPVVVPAQVTPAVEPKAVRAWAKANGHEVGERGRIRPEVISAYVKASGKAVGPKAKSVEVPRTRVRPQNVAYGILPRRKGDPSYVSEPVLAVSNCGTCKATIGFCACATPTLPAHYGRAPLSFTAKDALAAHAAASPRPVATA